MEGNSCQKTGIVRRTLLSVARLHHSAVAGRLSELIYSHKPNHKAENYEKLKISLWSLNAKKEAVISKLSC